MKNNISFPALTLILVSIFCFLEGTSQVSPKQRLAHDLQESTSLNDSIASIISYRALTFPDSLDNVSTLYHHLNPQRPTWYEIEKCIIKDRSNYTLLDSLYKKLNNKETALHRYVKGEMIYVNAQYYDIDTQMIKNYIPINTLDSALYVYYGIKEIRGLMLKDSALVQLKKFIKISDKLGRYPGLRNIAEKFALRVYFNQVDSTILPYVNDCINLAESIGSHNVASYMYNMRAYYYSYTGNYTAQIKDRLAGIEHNKKTNDFSGLAVYYSNLIDDYLNRRSIDKAEEYVIEIKKLADITEKNSIYHLYYSSKAEILKSNKNYEAAIDMFKKSMTFQDKKSSVFNQLSLLLTIMDSYESDNNVDSTYAYYKKIELLDPDNRYGYKTYARAFAARYLVENNRFDEAQLFLDDALNYAESLGSKAMKEAYYKTQSILYYKSGQYAKAYDALEEFIILNQQIAKESTSDQVTEAILEEQFQKEKELIALKNEQEQATLKEQQIRAYLIGGASLIGLLLISFFYLILRNKNHVIKNQNNVLQELNKVKDTLFQIIGHDLKKPSINFRNISKNINYLLEKKDYATLQKLGHEVDQDAKSLYSLTDNLLNWALLQKENITIRKKNTNVYEVVQYNIGLFQSLANTKKISLLNNIEPHLYANVDPNSIDAMIRNLTDNAIKYTNNGGEIIFKSKVMDGLLQIQVQDNGIGMDSKALLSHKQGEVLESKKGTSGESGSGIGLQLVKQLASKNNASLKIKSIVGEGSTFILEFPKAS